MSASPSIIDTLVDNAKYIPDAVDARNEKGLSPCEVKCKEQQAALVACMESIRQLSEDLKKTSANPECLAPSVAAWTECCSKANSESQ